MKLNKMFCVFALLSGISSAPSFAQTCVAGSYTDTDITNALASTGTAMLCQGQTYTLRHHILLSSNQKLYTQGFPTSSTQMATLIWANNTPIPTGVLDPPGNTATPVPYAIIDAYGTGINIQSIIVDGNLAHNTYYGHSPLLANRGSRSTGPNSVSYVTLQHTLGFVALDAADDPSCSSLSLTNNYINSNGVHLPQGGVKQAWANGITIRCSNATVANNQIRDASDGGIDFLGGTNTMIQSNWIANSGQSAYGGILVDPVMGTTGSVDFTGSYVQNNLIQTSAGIHMHAAISVGTQYSCALQTQGAAGNNGNCQVALNPHVINNSGSGTFGWGIYIGGTTGATVTGNNLTVTLLPGMSCSSSGSPSSSDYYVLNTPHVQTSPATPLSTGTFQATPALPPGAPGANSYEWPCIVVPSEGSF